MASTAAIALMPFRRTDQSRWRPRRRVGKDGCTFFGTRCALDEEAASQKSLRSLCVHRVDKIDSAAVREQSKLRALIATTDRP